MSTGFQRRLAAIVAVDVIGYSRLMGKDETATLAALNDHRAALIDPLATRDHGRMVKTMGDGFLLEFPPIDRSVSRNPDAWPLHLYRAACPGNLERLDEVRGTFGDASIRTPEMSEASVRATFLYREARDIDRLVEGLRLAGLEN